MNYQTFITTQDNESIWVDIEYNIIPSLKATETDPPQGGIEVIHIDSQRQLSIKEEALAIQDLMFHTGERLAG